MSKDFIYKLVNPFKHGESQITELVFHPITGRDLMSCERSQSDTLRYAFELAGYLCGQTSEAMEKVNGADVHQIIAMTEAFFLGIQPTGDKPSE